MTSHAIRFQSALRRDPGSLFCQARGAKHVTPATRAVREAIGIRTRVLLYDQPQHASPAECSKYIRIPTFSRSPPPQYRHLHGCKIGVKLV